MIAVLLGHYVYLFHKRLAILINLIKIKSRIKTYKDSITTNFDNKNGSKEIPEEKVPHKCLSIIILDSLVYAYEKYHPQTFLEECKYAKENIKTILMRN